MAQRVAGELYESITGQLFEIGRQLRQPKGYPFDPETLKKHLQMAVEGIFTVTLANWFVTRKGLYVYPNFSTRVLPFAKEGDTAVIAGCSHVDLPRNMCDSEIIAEYLGDMEEAKKYAFTLNQVKAFITNHWNGESGQLLNNGHANIFYVTGVHDNLFALYVRWRGDEWYVDVWELDEIDCWLADGRVFRNKP